MYFSSIFDCYPFRILHSPLNVGLGWRAANAFQGWDVPARAFCIQLLYRTLQGTQLKLNAPRAYCNEYVHVVWICMLQA